MRQRTHPVSNGALWSDDDVIALDSLFRKNHSIYYIAKQLNRSPRAVLHKLYKYTRRCNQVCSQDPDNDDNDDSGDDGDDNNNNDNGGDDGDIDEDTYIRDMKYADAVFDDHPDLNFSKGCFALGVATGVLVSVGSTAFVYILNQSLRAMY